MSGTYHPESEPDSLVMSSTDSFLQLHSFCACMQNVPDALVPLHADVRLQLRQDVLSFVRCMREDNFDVDPIDLACSLASMGYSCRMRRAVGGNIGGQDCFKNLFHEFLLVKVRL